ncbi:hypothetical protein AB4Z19_29740 [Pseudoduganella sp. RAF19]|uniref:hypothetical protein n=2 Tax=unclassified Pseudoduganella TaxID=2637179 RepID=UPI003F9D9960
MHIKEKAGPSRTMTQRRISDILELIKEFQALHGGRFPTTRSSFPRPNGSWNAIDGALRRDAIVQCQHFVALKAALLRRGLTPSLARLDPSYRPTRAEMRTFGGILEIIALSRVENRGRFPLRTDPFAVRGHSDTWIAIDSALTTGAICECTLWTAHRDKMAQLGVKPSLASLNPAYQPVRRTYRSIASIKTAIGAFMMEHAGVTPTQRAPYPASVPFDSWKAICKALRLGTIDHDADWVEFRARLELSQRKASLFTFIDLHRHELRSMYEASNDAEVTHGPIPVRPSKAKQVRDKPVQFEAVIEQLFRPIAPLARADVASNGIRLAKRLIRDER